MDTSLFTDYLTSKLPLVEAWMKRHVWQAQGVCSEELERYLYAPLARFNANAGKRVRPILALLGCEAVGSEAKQALSVGCAIELFQSAALIHDDIADDGKTRRDEPCLHISQGVGLAINTGDGALIQAAEAIIGDEGLSAETKLALMKEFIAMERRTLEGQALDLGWVRDNRWDLSPDSYLTMATLKTAHYSSASPLVMGALAGGATPEKLEALRRFGLAAGLAFQIEDDLLNLVGDANAQGKDFRSDISEGKRTYVALCALELLEGEEKLELEKLLSSHTTNKQALERAVGLMEKSGALSCAKTKAQALVDEATHALQGFHFANEASEKLISMAHFFIERSY